MIHFTHHMRSIRCEVVEKLCDLHNTKLAVNNGWYFLGNTYTHEPSILLRDQQSKRGLDIV